MDAELAELFRQAAAVNMRIADRLSAPPPKQVEEKSKEEEEGWLKAKVFVKKYDTSLTTLWRMERDREVDACLFRGEKRYRANDRTLKRLSKKRAHPRAV